MEDKEKIKKDVDCRKKIQLILSWITLILLIGGYFYPLVGAFVIVMMMTGFIISFFKGRWWCGWICPLGAFLEWKIFNFAKKRKVPAFLKDLRVRVILLIAMTVPTIIELFKLQGARLSFESFTPGFFQNVVFAAILFIFWKSRSWCAACPQGTMLGILGRDVYQIKISDSCVKCGVCQKNCPISTFPGAYKELGYVPGYDCARCKNCIASCPKNALSFE